MSTPLDAILGGIRAKLRGRNFGLPLTVNEVEAFEGASKVRLPEEYRRFLVELANGGSGPPLYGLMKLGEVPSGFPRTRQHQMARLAQPFPLSEYWVWEDDEPLDEDQVALRELVRDGTLVLGHDGCGMYWHLVVTGPERGQIWQVTGEGAQPCAPRRGFLSWFEYRLDGHDDCWCEFQPRS